MRYPRCRRCSRSVVAAPQGVPVEPSPLEMLAAPALIKVYRSGAVHILAALVPFEVLAEPVMPKVFA